VLPAEVEANVSATFGVAVVTVVTLTGDTPMEDARKHRSPVAD